MDFTQRRMNHLKASYPKIYRSPTVSATEEDMSMDDMYCGYHPHELSRLPDSILHAKPDPYCFFHPKRMRPEEVQFYKKKMDSIRLNSCNNVSLEVPFYSLKWCPQKEKRKRPDELGASDFETSVKSLAKEGTRDIYKLIDYSDVVIQVLDARDPQGTRCYHLEKHMKENCKHKHMVLLLNKRGLVPAFSLEGWVQLLSKGYPTLAFDARNNKSFGQESLLSVLEQFALLKNDMQPLSVCFVGYPNVGKSSVINCLCTKNVCNEAPIPGKIEEWHLIALTKRIFLIDCPGVYNNIDTEADVILRSLVPVANLQDALDHIGEVLRHVRKGRLQRAYHVDDWVDENDFLHKLCMTRNLLKDGQPDLMTVAKMVLHDLQIGKITFYVPPPEQDEGDAEKSNLPDASGKPTISTDKSAVIMKANSKKSFHLGSN